MASPKVLIQILISGSRILGKAFAEAGRQAVKNARATPQAAIGNEAEGVGNATSGSGTDLLTRQHRMTLDEAHLILNLRRGAELENLMKNYEHLYKANSPPPPPEVKATNGKQPPSLAYSHYLQSKVVRARDRLEAEMKIGEPPEPPLSSSEPPTPGPSAPPPKDG